MSEANATAQLPLEGVRILELANVIAGPSIGAHLSDFGATVVKVERPGEGDISRSVGETIGSRSAWWLMLARNKQVVTLDLKQEADRERFLELIADVDCFVESNRPGVLERLGLAPARLHEVNPRLIIVRISAYGQDGPYADRPGFGTLAEAFAGLAAIQGFPDRPPLLPPIPLADHVTGLFGTWALLAALYHRDVHGGPGQTIDLSLYEAVVSLLGPLPMLYHHEGVVQQRQGSRAGFASPRNVYATRDGHFFAVSGTAPSAAERVMRIIGGEALLADPRFATPAERMRHADELDQLTADWIGAHDVEEVERAFYEAHAAGIRVLTIDEAVAHPQFEARGTFVDVPDEELGSVFMTSPVPRLSETPGRIAFPGLPAGADDE